MVWSIGIFELLSDRCDVTAVEHVLRKFENNGAVRLGVVSGYVSVDKTDIFLVRKGWG